jgi:hypothetical protein
MASACNAATCGSTTGSSSNSSNSRTGTATGGKAEEKQTEAAAPAPPLLTAYQAGLVLGRLHEAGRAERDQPMSLQRPTVEEQSGDGWIQRRAALRTDDDEAIRNASQVVHQPTTKARCGTPGAVDNIVRTCSKRDCGMHSRYLGDASGWGGQRRGKQGQSQSTHVSE